MMIILWSLTSLEMKVRARTVRQAEDLLDKSKITGMPSIEPVQERAMEAESSSSSSFAYALLSQENRVRLVCKSRYFFPKMPSKITFQNMPANYWSDDLIGAISCTINKPCL